MPPNAGAGGEARDGRGREEWLPAGTVAGIGRKCAFYNGFAGSVPTKFTDGADISLDGMPAALDLIFSRELGGMAPYTKDLLPGAVLRALAGNPSARPYSIEFVSQVGMPTSSIRRIISRLADSRIIYSSVGTYRFSNPFFREWILRR